MLDNLTGRLGRIVKTIRGEARLTEGNIQDALREVRVALLEADCALAVVKDFISAVKEKALGAEVIGSLTPGQAFIGVVHRELTRLMGEANVGLDLATQPPAVILMAGLQGSGKTTSTGKLAMLLVGEKRKVLTVSCDVYRPAAIEQLKTVAAQAGADFFPSVVGEPPVDIARRALEHARTRYYDVLLVDTAGRLAIDEPMMREIAELHALLNPIETLFTVDAMQGQDAVNVSKIFAERLPLTGVILTKLDGDARGGAALSVRHVTGKPIKFAGVGEKLGGLESFHPERMASRILGMGDILSLVEEAHKQVDLEQAKRVADKIKKGKGFDLEDFKQQIAQMNKMGGLASLIDKLPAQLTGQIDAARLQDDKPMRRIEGIINSMTREERSRPELIKASRKRRIAAGSGVAVQEVNRLLKQFEEMQKMMKAMKGGNMMRMMQRMKGSLPGMR
ncbi:MAG: signal recognition particle protein [Betaproteobacteria bacterium]|nr:signal recognition particle protein [Betaproteobacteria bacterium]